MQFLELHKLCHYKKYFLNQYFCLVFTVKKSLKQPSLKQNKIHMKRKIAFFF